MSQIVGMPARASHPPLTRVYLVERVDQLAYRIENSLSEMKDRVGFERTYSVASAAHDLAYIDPDVVVINVDELDAGEWSTLAELRETHPDLRFYGLSDNPGSDPSSAGARDDYLPLVTDLDQLKRELSGPRAAGS